MTESDKKYYENQKRQEYKKDKAMSKAKNRGEVSLEWHKTNVLNKDTLPKFKALMKKTDKEWEDLNKLK